MVKWDYVETCRINRAQFPLFNDGWASTLAQPLEEQFDRIYEKLPSIYSYNFHRADFFILNTAKQSFPDVSSFE